MVNPNALKVDCPRVFRVESLEKIGEPGYVAYVRRNVAPEPSDVSQAVVSQVSSALPLEKKISSPKPEPAQSPKTVKEIVQQVESGKGGKQFRVGPCLTVDSDFDPNERPETGKSSSSPNTGDVTTLQKEFDRKQMKARQSKLSKTARPKIESSEVSVQQSDSVQLGCCSMKKITSFRKSSKKDERIVRQE